MSDIFLHQTAWRTTFPRRVYPQLDEWFPGVLLRCDEMNHWNSGTTFRYLIHSIRQPRYGFSSSLIVVPTSILQGLARLLEIPWKSLLATTYQPELSQLYAPRNIQQEQLIGKWKKPFYVCPECVAQTRLLARTLTLPYLHYCPVHHIKFRSFCVCKKRLWLFDEESLPFRCFYCGLDWGQLPQVQIPPDLKESENDLYMLYKFFLMHGTYEMKINILNNIRKYLERDKRTHVYLKNGENKYNKSYYAHLLSVSYMVDLIISAGFSLKDVIPGGFLSS